jgi:hypothetical protein
MLIRKAEAVGRVICGLPPSHRGQLNRAFFNADWQNFDTEIFVELRVRPETLSRIA